MTVVSLFGPGVKTTTPRMGSDPGRPSKRPDYNATTPIGAGLTESTMMQSVITAAYAGSAGWRIQERIKTVAVGLVLCLHIGVDPPDILKTQPCAKLECWFDPSSSAGSQSGSGDGNGRAQKPIDSIGRNLVAQYEFWQPRARYKLIGDPTIEEVRKLAQSLRKSAKDERVLVHWNGHGTPRPTKAGEIWVFNRQFTQYIPLSVADVVGWLGLPCSFVIDASGAGHVYDALLSCVPQACQAQNSEGRYMVVLAACQANEILPMSPDLPADLFTACLTTPLEIAVRWHVLQSGSLTCPKAKNGVEALMSLMPGRLNDRKTVLGELHWIFTAISDTIAWLLFPREVFKALFRQDLMTASLFRNFLLAQRLMRPYQCTPMSWPPVPPGSATHKLWLVWDHVLDEALGKVEGGATGQFFTEQMDAFEAWLDQAFVENELGHLPSVHLPIVLQVLLSQTHRARALSLLVRFIDLGPAMTKDALDVGILPYILKLLQSPCPEIRHALLSVWTRVLAYDGSTQKDLAKDDAYLYFVKCLSQDDLHGEAKTMASMCLSVFWHLSPTPAKHDSLLASLFESASLQLYRQTASVEELLWMVNCMAALWEGNAEVKVSLARETHRDLMNRIIVPLARHRDWRLRAAACHLAGTFLCPESLELPSILLELEQDMLLHLSSSLLLDASEEARTELIVCLSKCVFKHFNKFALAAYDIWEGHGEDKPEDKQLVPVASGDLVRNPSTYSILWESVLSLSLDPSDSIARLASSLVDEIHMSFLFMGVTSSITKEVLFVQQEEIRRSPSPTLELKQPLAKSGNRFVLTSALPLVSDFITSCHLEYIKTQKTVMRERLEEEHGFTQDPVGIYERSVLMRHLSECQSSPDARFDRQLALLAHGAQTTRLAFHPYMDRLIVADSRNRLSVWDWSSNVKGSVFVNGNPERLTEISGLISIPSDRLLVASTDGIVRCWHPDYEGSGNHKPADLVGVCQLVADVGTGSPIFEIDHVGSTCYAVANSDRKPRYLYGWDLARSNGLPLCPLGFDASPTSIRASGHETGLVFVGSSSGLLSQYDLRSTTPLTTTFQAHEAWVVDLFESPGNPHYLISASVLGDLCIFDRRNPSSRMMRYDLLGGSSGVLTFAGHDVMPTLAVGSTDQALRFLSLGKLADDAQQQSGFSLHTVKYHEGLFGQRIGPPSTAAFHPNRPIYAAASTDMVIALYGTSTSPPSSTTE